MYMQAITEAMTHYLALPSTNRGYIISISSLLATGVAHAPDIVVESVALQFRDAAGALEARVSRSLLSRVQPRCKSTRSRR